MISHAQQSASVNYSGICPEAWAAMAAAKAGHAPAYSEDAWTARAADAFRTLFETPFEVFLAFNGTAANAPADENVQATRRSFTFPASIRSSGA
ncbi:beta-eliminating lyase-related protein [Methylobacterium gregans]|uniref:Aromatic amino acid beta-eliminating lyase/threonine aldolase domain-containing protein n=1 Tax=Methylobacterium gregans TaxID=374424 RepID=A0AA37HLD0_9HYPH|nr:beta-eliminating lyase-related protein [Methylobacterium gregans]MDQ0522025.1 threonine aldolase [Methylobacterium gregans]GJD76987.1 hypothetical protein NBEOAGPD_0188 [Methylobacterium gregans]GLS56738.1 hypothetical protein GCM10007886_49240 [Methylobacterium gregans]